MDNSNWHVGFNGRLRDIPEQNSGYHLGGFRMRGMVASWPLSREELHWLAGEDMRCCVKLDPSLGTKF